MIGTETPGRNSEEWFANFLGVTPTRAKSGYAQARRYHRNNKPNPAAILQSARPIDLRTGTWLDHDICIEGEAGGKLLETVLLKLRALEQAKRQAQPDKRHRARTRDQERNFELRVQCLLANALRAHFYRETNRVAYGRGSTTHVGKEPWMSPSSFAKTVDLMVEAGLVSEQRGQWEGQPGVWEGYASTYWLAEPLLEQLAAYGIRKHSFGKRSPSSGFALVRLRGGEEADKDLRYDQTIDTQRWANDLDFYNQFSECFDVGIELDNRKEERELIAWCNRKRSETSRQPNVTGLETFNRYLERIFNDATFEHGGRLYGAWWQYVPAWLRKRITIDYEETVELDFSCMSVRMLHHLHGSDFREDAYDLPDLSAYAERKFGDPAYYREDVKKIVQAMLNNEDETKRPEMTDLDHSLPRQFTRARIKDLILEKHSKIRDTFDDSLGKRLQRLDSDIALDIIISLMDEDILALPIHDSFIVQKEHKQTLHNQMIKSYRKRFDFDPIIK